VKLLIDESLSGVVAELLTTQGHDVVHVAERDLLRVRVPGGVLA
jgi:hypothetical protein